MTCHKGQYERQVWPQDLHLGDQVLLRNVGIVGKHKIMDCWRPTPYVIERQIGNLPIYKIRAEDGSGVLRTVHCNLLLPVGELVGRFAVGPNEQQVQRNAQLGA